MSLTRRVFAVRTADVRIQDTVSRSDTRRITKSVKKRDDSALECQESERCLTIRRAAGSIRGVALRVLLLLSPIVAHGETTMIIEMTHRTEAEGGKELALRSSVGELAEEAQIVSLPNLADIDEQALSLRDEARSIQITSQPTYIVACNKLKDVKGLRRIVDERIDPFLDVRRKRVEVTRGYKAEHAAPLDQAEAILKEKKTGWEDKCRAEEEERRRKAQAEADEKARIEQERRVAELRAANEARIAAERVAAEERDKAERAEAARKLAEAKAQAAEASSKRAKAAAERAITEAKEAKAAEERRIAERAKTEAARIEAERLQAEAEVQAQAEAEVQAPIIEMVSRLPKVEGQSSRDSWSAAMRNKVQYIRWLAQQSDDRIAELVTEKAVNALLVPLNQLAKAMKRSMQVEGVQAVCETIQSSTRTRDKVAQ